MAGAGGNGGGIPRPSAAVHRRRVGVVRKRHASNSQWIKHPCQGRSGERGPAPGPDRSDVRRYVGWYRHITLAKLAHVFLAALTAQAAEKGDSACQPSAGSSSAAAGSLSRE
ncbi:hypothetical protein DT019_33895 [Streptomyces sp. SDr-06]|nr:hypothetical protein DT019_33895 [Streptomyces sp. SDr-06]